MGLASADEGFWLVTDVPVAEIKSKHGFAPSPLFLDHLMRSAAKFDSGGNSGGFVSADGLWLTNWHIGIAFVRKLEDGPRILHEGFYAPTLDKELRLPALSPGTGVPIKLRTVEAIEDVTARVHAAANLGERAKIIAEIEKEATGEARRGEVVKIDGGGRYQLYRYRIYTDIRLVFMPEEQAAILPIPHNDFIEEAHRTDYYNFDVAIFRIYENGKPLKPKHFLRWSVEPLQKGELIFGSGDPGYSWRHDPQSRFKLDRDVRFPIEREMQRRLHIRTEDVANGRPIEAGALKFRLNRMDDHRRQTEDSLDKFFMPRRFVRAVTREEILRSKPSARDAYNRADAAHGQMAHLYPRYFVLDEWAGLRSDLWTTALRLVRLSRERQKAVEDRLPAYRDVSAVENDLAADKSFDPEYEAVRIGVWLDMLVDHLGASDPLVGEILSGQTPRERARTMSKSRLADSGYRRMLLNPAALAASADPAIVAARVVDLEGRHIRDDYQSQESIARDAIEEIGQHRYSTFGRTLYPEANGTLRLTYGVVSGAAVPDGQQPSWTTFGDMFRFVDRLGQPGLVAKSWIDARARLDPVTPFNVATTVDCTGGSSGTPLTNRRGAFVGVLNYSNSSLATASASYDPGHDRCAIVSSVAIIEGLRKVYFADTLADELSSGRRK